MDIRFSGLNVIQVISILEEALIVPVPSPRISSAST